MPTAVSCRLCELQQQHHRVGGVLNGGLLCPASAAAAGTPLSVLPGHRPMDRRRPDARDRSRDVGGGLYSNRNNSQLRARPQQQQLQQQQPVQQQQHQHLHDEAAHRHRHGHHTESNGASVLLATPSPSSSRDRWRQRRRRSPSRRQRIHASLLRQFSPRRSSPPPTYSSDYSKCPLCQPRYSPSPDRLGLKPVMPRNVDSVAPSVASPLAASTSLTTTTSGSAAPRGRPPKPQTYQPAALASSNNVDKKSNVSVEYSSRNQRRSKSEYRQRKSPSRLQVTPKFYDVDIDAKRQKAERDLSSWTSTATTTTSTTLTMTTYHNEVNGNHGYCELKEIVAPAKKVSKSQVDEKKVRTRSKSRSRCGQIANNGLLTVWPGKEGVWLPQ